jgi:tetratricopeptide (TPR) repeat protein
MRKGNFNRAINEADLEISLTDKAEATPHYFRALGLKAISQALLGKTEQAKESILRGERILEKQKMVVAWYIVPFQVGRLMTYIGFLKMAVKDRNHSGVRSIQGQFYNEAKKTLRLSKNFAPYRTWIFKIMGDYYWLINKQSKAFKWWGKAIKEGERLGARPDLSRTYFEVGKRLLDPKSKHKKLNGIDAREYLDKARALFEEMGLKREMDNLDRLKADRSF